MISKQIYPLPLYFQIVEDITKKIGDGFYVIGHAIPTETELTNIYKVSRITIRRALQDLISSGLIFTKQGKGTFVAKPKAIQNLNNVSNWAQTIKALGMEPYTEEVKFEEMPANTEIKNKLNIELGIKITKIERIRYADNEPMCIMTNFLISDMVPNIIEIDLRGSISLYEILENKYNFVLKSAIETVEAKNANAFESDILKVAKNKALLNVTRLTYNNNDIPIEIVKTISRGDRYSYTMNLYGRP